MKSQFSTSWLSSKQPRKQRKYRYNAPLHKRHTFLNAQLSEALRKKYGKRSLPLKKGDEALVMRGSFKSKKAKISSINLKKSLVILEGLQRSKKDGTKVAVYFRPNKLQLISLNIEDKKRLAVLNKQSSEANNASQKTGSNN